ncbi:transporter substrate-binding domain-containing protein [Paucibacter sp. R3-3]|uniref:Transporter substrate-binding domain-containing protein n=1 Tax=Roseateles agri TaxID=3098619 RepID=A0ABU5DE48_9BURK|nr:transporter substrate-binding domain-containing protein [Paucibacter sp. R3-3]MDY0744551.1 transporter substrate-binding domain-containing protein [Paucibacter sp. R3-3]
MPRAWSRALALAALLLAWQGLALAGCSRTVVAPMAPSGRLVFAGEGDRLRGVWPELLEEVGRSVGCRFAIASMPRPRMDMEFLAGRTVDLLISATRTPERDRWGEFVPLFRQPLVIVTRRDEPVPGNLAALRQSGWRMAVQRNFHFSTEYRSLVSELEAAGRVDAVNGTEAAARMIRAGRVDFTLMSPPQAQATAGGDLVFRRFEDLPLMEVGLYLSRARLSSADLTLLRDALGRAARDGLVRRVFLRHYLPEIVNLNQGL